MKTQESRPSAPTRRLTWAILSAALTAMLLVTGSAAAAAQAGAFHEPDTTFGSGTLVVGEDIAPGTYQAEVPPGSTGCYWARLSDLTGDLDAILANENLEPGDMATVTIKPDDAGFESSRCGTWRPSTEVGPDTPVTSFDGGTWIIGEDVQPGTYKTTVPDNEIGCYWARLGDLSGGGSDSILANDNVDAGDRVTVDIRDSDTGFTSSGCGTWEGSGG